MRNQTDKLTDNVINNVRELPAETRRILGEASERVSEYYDISKDFVRENQVLVFTGISLVCGVVGFFLGRSSGKEM